MSDRNWRPKGGEWEPIKISFEIDPSAYIPKITTNPQILDEVWSSYRRAKPTQNSSRNEREKIWKRSRKTAILTVRDRSDRSLWPVRPVGLDLNFQTDQTGYTDWSNRSLLDSPQPKLQMANLEQTKSKSNEIWRIPSHLSRKHIPKRSLPKDKRILRIWGKIKVDWGFLKNTKIPIRENSRFQGVWH